MPDPDLLGRLPKGVGQDASWELGKAPSGPTERIYMCCAQALKGPEQPQSACSRNQGYYPQDDRVCAFLPERHKNLGNPVNSF